MGWGSLMAKSSGGAKDADLPLLRSLFLVSIQPRAHARGYCLPLLRSWVNDTTLGVGFELIGCREDTTDPRSIGGRAAGLGLASAPTTIIYASSPATTGNNNVFMIWSSTKGQHSRR